MNLVHGQIGAAYEETSDDIPLHLNIGNVNSEVEFMLSNLRDSPKNCMITISFGKVIRAIKRLFLQAVVDRRAFTIRVVILDALKKCYYALDTYIEDFDNMNIRDIHGAHALAMLYVDRLVKPFQNLDIYANEIATMYSERSVYEPHLNTSDAFLKYMKNVFWETDRIKIQQDISVLRKENAKLKEQLESVKSLIGTTDM